MAEIRKIYNEFIHHLPIEDQIPIKICPTLHDMIDTHLKNNCGYIKPAHKRINQTLNEYKAFCNSDNYRTKYVNVIRQICDGHIKRFRFNIIALATQPILINRGALRYANKLRVITIILHEIGHIHNGKFGSKEYMDEYQADIFAYKWLQKLYTLGIVDEYIQDKDIECKH